MDINGKQIQTIQIPEFPPTTTLEGSGAERIPVTKADGITYSISSADFKAFLGTVQAARALSPTDPAPTVAGVYIPTETANVTYANAGNINVNTAEGGDDYGKYPELIRDELGNWAKASFPLPTSLSRNQFFVKGSAASTNTVALNAILEVEWYNVPADEIRVFYAIGKNYGTAPGVAYLAFKRKLNSRNIIPIGWSDTSNSSEVTIGVKEYFLREVTAPDTMDSAIGRIVIDWEAVPSGFRYMEATTATSNSHFLPWTFKEVEIEGEEPGVNKFFEAGSTAASNAIATKGILDIEWYNVDVANGDFRAFYALGNNYLTSGELRTYVAFRAPNPNRIIVPLEWDTYYILDSPQSGTKEYLLRFEGDPKTEQYVIGKVLINWDAVGLGKRYLQSTSATSNSKFGTWTYNKATGGGESRPISNSTQKQNIVYGGDLTSYYDTQVIASYASGNTIPIGLSDVQSFYNLWDDLMALSNGYITKRTLGTDIPATGGTTLPMYAYEFNPPTREPGDPTAINPTFDPKIIAVTAIHGNEKTGALCWYEFMKQAVTNWEGDPLLTTLRWEVPFVIIPVGNPSGWAGGGTRKNFNGVDLNRNFDVGWYAQSPTSDTYGGAAPLDQKESQYIKALLEEYKDNGFIFMDLHNFHGNVESDITKYSLCWTSTPYRTVLNIGKALARIVTPVYRSKSTFIPDTPNWLVGTTSIGGGAGKLSPLAASLGYYACTFEVTQKFRFNPDHQDHDSDAIRFGVESQANFLRLMLKDCSIDFNSRQ